MTRAIIYIASTICVSYLMAAFVQWDILWPTTSESHDRALWVFLTIAASAGATLMTVEYDP